MYKREIGCALKTKREQLNRRCRCPRNLENPRIDNAQACIMRALPSLKDQTRAHLKGGGGTVVALSNFKPENLLDSTQY